MNFRQQVANNIERMIGYSNKNKARIARELGVKPTTVTDYTSGRSLPDAQKIKLLCIILDCTYIDILGRLDEPM